MTKDRRINIQLRLGHQQAFRDALASVRKTLVLPSISKVVESAKSVLKGLEDSDSGDNELGDGLREFIKLAEPVLKWEKANRK